MVGGGGEAEGRWEEHARWVEVFITTQHFPCYYILKNIYSNDSEHIPKV